MLFLTSLNDLIQFQCVNKLLYYFLAAIFQTSVVRIPMNMLIKIRVNSQFKQELVNSIGVYHW
jgi:hypothetical protein